MGEESQQWTQEVDQVEREAAVFQWQASKEQGARANVANTLAAGEQEASPIAEGEVMVRFEEEPIKPELEQSANPGDVEMPGAEIEDLEGTMVSLFI